MKYIEDFKCKFPNIHYSDSEITKRLCVNRFYRNKSMLSCERSYTMKECIKCWNEEMEIKTPKNP